MRDLIDLLEDRTLSAGVIKKYPERFDKFILMIRNHTPFYTVDKEKVIANPTEADRFQEMFDNDAFTGSQSLLTMGGDEIPFNRLLKTPDLGGQASTGEEGEETSKEGALVKPTQIKIVDYDIPASQLGNEIINNDVLNSTDYGQAIIHMAKEIMSGRPAIIPKEFLKQEKIRKSIVDYAGEYLGVLALVHGATDFPKKDAFTKWLGKDTSDLILNFPAKSNNNIADSFAMVKNADTNHTINISSKGQGGGAPPSVSGLKVPDRLRKVPAFKPAIDFIELCQNKNIPSPTTVSQVFLAMNLIQEVNPDAIPEEFNEFLPWEQSIVGEVVASINAYKRKQNLPLKQYQSLWANINFKKPSSDGGKLTHAVKLAVMQAVNEGDAIPEFQAVILKILDMNFIQQYAEVDTKTGVMSFATQWPATLEGNITLDSKSGGTDPTKGGFSFKLSNEKPKTKLAEPDELGVGAKQSKIGTEKEFGKTAANIATGRVTKKKQPVGDIGREKRKR